MIVNDGLERTIKGSGHGLFYCTNQECPSSIHKSHTQIRPAEHQQPSYTAKLLKTEISPHAHNPRYISGNTGVLGT
jgi:hypothetical protein